MVAAPFDAVGVVAYMAPDPHIINPGLDQPYYGQPPTPFLPVYQPPVVVVTTETIRGLDKRIDALVKRCDDLQGAFSDLLKRANVVEHNGNGWVERIDKRLDALEAARTPTTEPKDCVVVFADGTVTAKPHTLVGAESIVRSSKPGARIMRLVPPESKP